MDYWLKYTPVRGEIHPLGTLFHAYPGVEIRDLGVSEVLKPLFDGRKVVLSDFEKVDFWVKMTPILPFSPPLGTRFWVLDTPI